MHGRTAGREPSKRWSAPIRPISSYRSWSSKLHRRPIHPGRQRKTRRQQRQYSSPMPPVKSWSASGLCIPGCRAKTPGDKPMGASVACTGWRARSASRSMFDAGLLRLSVGYFQRCKRDKRDRQAWSASQAFWFTLASSLTILPRNRYHAPSSREAHSRRQADKEAIAEREDLGCPANGSGTLCGIKIKYIPRQARLVSENSRIA